MSLVIVAFTREFGVLACDGRVTDSDNNAICEDFKKYHQVNDHVIVGFAGQANRCQIMIDYLDEQLASQEKSQISVVDVYKHLQLPVVQSQLLNTDVNMKFLILVKTKTHKYGVFPLTIMVTMMLALSRWLLSVTWALLLLTMELMVIIMKS